MINLSWYGAKHFYCVSMSLCIVLRHSSFSASSIFKRVFKESSLMHSVFRIWYAVLWDFHISDTTETKLVFLFCILRLDSTCLVFKNTFYAGIKIFSSLPHSLTILKNATTKVHILLIKYLNTHPIYRVDDFFNI